MRLLNLLNEFKERNATEKVIKYTAFGPFSSLSYLGALYSAGAGIPPNVKDVLGRIRSLLEKTRTGDLEPFKMNWGDKSRIFVESWVQLYENEMLKKICLFNLWLPCIAMCWEENLRL
jgi:hypothetical protein